MEPARTLRMAFLLLAAAHVTGLQVAAASTAWTGSAALAVLLLLSLLPGPVGVVRRRPRHALRLALAALTAAALLLDARAGGLGWPAALGAHAGPGGWGPVEAALLAVAGGAAAAAAVGAVGPPRRLFLPTLGVILPTVGTLPMHLRPPISWQPAREAPYEAAASAPLQSALMLLGFAVAALVAARRWAAATALAVLAMLLVPVLSGVLHDPRLESPQSVPRPADVVVIHRPVPNFGMTLQPVDLPDTSRYRPGEYHDDLRDQLGQVADRRPTILPPPEPPRVVDAPPPEPTGVWITETRWRGPAWISLTVLLALVALGGLPGLPGTDPVAPPDLGLGGG